MVQSPDSVRDNVEVRETLNPYCNARMWDCLSCMTVEKVVYK